jgi:hypothetical protein
MFRYIIDGYEPNETYLYTIVKNIIDMYNHLSLEFTLNFIILKQNILRKVNGIVIML